MNPRYFILIMTCLICLLLSGCSTVNFVKEVDQTMKQIDRLNDRLHVIDMNTEAEKFTAVLAEMKLEAELLKEVDPGLFKGKGSKEVKQKSNAIIKLIDEIKQELQSELPEKERLGTLMKQLTYEIEEVME